MIGRQHPTGWPGHRKCHTFRVGPRILLQNLRRVSPELHLCHISAFFVAMSNFHANPDFMFQQAGVNGNNAPNMQNTTAGIQGMQPNNNMNMPYMMNPMQMQMLQQMQQGQMARWQMQKEVELACGGSPPSLSPCMHALVLTHSSIQMQMNQMKVFGVNGGGLDDRGMFLRHDGMDNGGMGVPGMMPNRMMPNAQVHSNVAGMMTHNTMQGNDGAHRRPNMMGGVLIYGFAAAVLGGLSSPFGAVVGGFLVGVFENLAGTYIPGVGNELKLPIALALIISVLVVKPAGLFGRHIVKRV